MTENNPGPVLVTGAGSGIGRAVCNRLLADGIGILGWDIDADLLREPFKGEGTDIPDIHRYIVDVSDVSLVRETMVQVNRKCATLGGLVNCAAIVAINRTEIDWDKILATNLGGYMNVAEAAIPHLAPDTAIVQISSLSASFGGSKMGAYSAAKGGVEAYTRVLAVELAGRRIRVNAIAPGWIATETNRPDTGSPAYINYTGRCPLARAGEAEEVASVTAFLLSVESSYVNGQVITVDGGWSISM